MAVFSWPLVHVSRYHLLLDGLAFVLLYRGLSEDRLSCRLLWVLCCALGSLLLPLVFSEQIYRLGLCGLSGVAHGLAAISGLEMLLVQRQRRIGAVLLVGLMLKVGFEVLSGQVVMQGLHLGSIGVPLVSTHAGGVVGGLVGFLLRRAYLLKRTAFR